MSNQRVRLWGAQNSTNVTRWMFVTPVAGQWIDRLSVIPAQKGTSARSRSRLSEYAQVSGLLDACVRGDETGRLVLAGMDPPFHRVSRNGVGHLHVWEARLAFVRLFGWWLEPRVWIGVEGDYADVLKKRAPHSPGSYEAHARSVARWRKVAGFTAANVWKGTDLNALLMQPNTSPVDR